MTIYTSKPGEKKDETDVPPPEVVSEYKMLVEEEKLKKPAVPIVAVRPPIVLSPRRRRFPLLVLCAFVLIVVLLVLLCFGGYQIYQHFSKPEQYVGRCGVRYHESSQRGVMSAMTHSGEFEQQVTINDMFHERIEVPSIGDTRQATVLHDFNQNITAIIDKEQHLCFLLPLDRTLVLPPRDFWDLLIKLKTGYYIPDVDVIRENYRALTPPLTDLTSYGYNIWNECHEFGTYKLVREGEPVAMSKRSAEWCSFAGEKWCLGDGGATKMLCVAVKDCL